jgi:CO/xanthine dehydrogenase FAD-binding subunit
MKPATFDMARPQTLDEALAILAQHTDDAKVIAGGQSLVPLMNFRLATPSLLVDLNRIATLAGIRRDGDRLRIGAMTRQSELIGNELVVRHAPLLRLAAPHIGHLQTRSRGTIGGSLVHADPSAELPLVAAVLDAEMTVQSRAAHRTIAAREFFVDAMMTSLSADELLIEVAIPIAKPDSRCSFRELARRHGDFAIVAVAAQFAHPHLTIAVGGLETRPRLCTRLARMLGERGFSRHELPELISAELDDAQPLSDLQASADYRRHLAAVLLERCLEEILH